jgi:cell division protein FtsZ
MSINGAMGVLVHFNMHPNFSMIELSEAMEVVHESADEEAEVIFGTTSDDSLPEDYVKITLVATGFEHEKVNKTEAPADTVKTQVKIRPKLVVGGDINEDFLEIPTYMRQQRD